MIIMINKDDRDCENFPSLRHYDNLPLPPSDIKDYNANQGPLTAVEMNDFNKEEYQKDRGITMKEHSRLSGGLHGRHENGVSSNKRDKLENNDGWEKDSTKNYLPSRLKGEDYS